MSQLDSWAAKKIHFYFENGSGYSKAKALFYSFMVGFLATLPIVYADNYLSTIYPSNYDENITEFLIKWLYSGVVITVLSVIEIYLLYLIALKLFVQLYKDNGIDKDEFFSDDFTYSFHAIMARVALESSEVPIKELDVELFRDKNKYMHHFKNLVYKLKIVFSNAIAKAFLRKLVVNSGARGLVNYIAAPITGFWDAMILYFVTNRMEFILKSSIKIDKFFANPELQKSIKSKRYQEILIRIVANAVSDEADYHPNYKHILKRLNASKWFDINVKKIENMHSTELLINEINLLDTNEKRDVLKFLDLVLSVSKKGKLSFISKINLV
jgi:hypothetical protein